MGRNNLGVVGVGVRVNCRVKGFLYLIVKEESGVLKDIALILVLAFCTYLVFGLLPKLMAAAILGRWPDDR